MALLLGMLGVVAGSPNSPRATIAQTSRQDPGGTILACAQELAGTSASWANRYEFGVGSPDATFIRGPLRSYAPLLGSPVSRALSRYQAAPLSEQRIWAANYVRGLATITPPAMGGSIGATSSPDYAKLSTLHGDFGPIPVMLRAMVTLAQHGYFEQYLLGVHPGHSLHLVNI